MIGALFVVLLAIGVPIAFVLGISSLTYLHLQQMSFVLVSQRFFVGVDNFLLLAVPLFILAGKLMNESGITDRLIEFFSILMGHVRGGLAYINIVASVFFAGITPFPYKVITIASGATALNFWVFMAASVAARGLRFFIVCGLLYWFGPPIRAFIERRLGLVTTLFLVCLVGGFIAIKFLH